MDLSPETQSVAADLADVQHAEPDASNIAGELTHRSTGDLTGVRLRDFQTVITRSALEVIHAHGRRTTEVEVGGVLVGNVHRDDHGAYLHILACIAGEQATSKAAQVTFTSETWARINEAMERNYRRHRIVGWYHTHPSFGIFLSEMDIFIQRNFFDLPWQVALVYDPVNEEDGIFVWRNGKCVREPFLIEEDCIETGYDFRRNLRPDPKHTVAGRASESLGGVGRSLRKLFDFAPLKALGKLAFWLCFFVAAFAITWTVMAIMGW